MVWGTWLLLSCKAEDLRIHLPPTGLAALSQEDLERDVWHLSKDSGDEWYLERMNQMGLSLFSTQHGTCVGTQSSRRVSVIRPEHTSLAISMAVQVSLAKVQHGHKNTYSFCIYESAIDRNDWLLGDMSGMILQVDKKLIHTRVPNLDIHYPKLVEHTQKIAMHISLLSD
ncbi:MAG: hypothetical protein CL916_08215 [Deltaproteobacteria bacterium]|nr:hypothetical protein [Deltaproteobacteria bacterium]